jgi:hypothetical protein
MKAAQARLQTFARGFVQASRDDGTFAVYNTLSEEETFRECCAALILLLDYKPRSIAEIAALACTALIMRERASGAQEASR